MSANRGGGKTSKGSRKKNLLLMAGPLKGGGLGLNGPAIKRRTIFCGFPKGKD